MVMFHFELSCIPSDSGGDATVVWMSEMGRCSAEYGALIILSELRAYMSCRSAREHRRKSEAVEVSRDEWDHECWFKSEFAFWNVHLDPRTEEGRHLSQVYTRAE